ncbi:MAG TPA: hypothetical protein VNO26_09010 [Candidatus Limnocylindria bacterium]|nr:hypothetical protein [Candidatus Limnocylindria bacterium]
MRGALLAIALACASAFPPWAGDREKHERRVGCAEARRSCKADCGPRDSGDLEASQRWVDCDAECHETYTACLDDCDP